MECLGYFPASSMREMTRGHCMLAQAPLFYCPRTPMAEEHAIEMQWLDGVAPRALDVQTEAAFGVRNDAASPFILETDTTARRHAHLLFPAA